MEGQIDRFLKAALDGHIMQLEKLAKKLDNGRGLLHTFTRVKDEDGRTALHLAASGGRMGICGYLINRIKVDVNLRDGNGGTPLHLAVSSNHLPVVKLLIKKGANIMLSSSRGYTPLHCAAVSGNTEILELLISKGAEINPLSESGTPVHWAAAKGKRESVKILLDHNADPNIVAHDLYTPLVTTIIAGLDECVELLLKGGADPNLHACGLSPLGYAAAEGMTKVVKCLLEAGADPNAIDTSGLTPLECAAENGDHEIVNILFPLTSPLQSFPDWSIPGIMKHKSSNEDNAQTSAMDFPTRDELILTAADLGDLVFFQKLEKKCRNKEELRLRCERAKSYRGITAIHIAATYGRLEICKFLIDNAGVDINIESENGITALMIAVTHEQKELVQYLISRGANINACTHQMITALHFAASHGNTELIQLLLSNGANVNAVTNDKTALDIAALEAHLESIQLLLDNGAKPDYTAMVSVIKGGSPKCLELLLKAGADPNTDWIHTTPLAYAAESGDVRLIKLLLKAKADPNAVCLSGLKAIERAARKDKREAVEVLFPVTKKIAYIRYWNVDGVMEHHARFWTL